MVNGILARVVITTFGQFICYCFVHTDNDETDDDDVVADDYDDDDDNYNNKSLLSFGLPLCMCAKVRVV